MKTLVSIVVPIYNVESYLRQCIDSILAQSIDEFEIILIDDGSTDSCPEICDEYSKTYNNIKVFHQKNAGVSVARNKGISHSKGEYICFIDSDDMIAPNFCELLLNGIKSTNSKIAFCKMLTISNDYIPKIEARTIETKTFSIKEHLKNQVCHTYSSSVCNCLFEKSIFSNLRFIEGHRYEDIIFNTDLLITDIDFIAYVDTPLYFYRQQENSFMNAQSKADTCNPDRIYASQHLMRRAIQFNLEFMDECLRYSIMHPWGYIDRLYLKREFKRNKCFLSLFKNFLKEHRKAISKNKLLSKITKHRLIVFSYSNLLYGINVYSRLLRLYIFKFLKKDPYKTGHGI